MDDFEFDNFLEKELAHFLKWAEANELPTTYEPSESVGEMVLFYHDVTHEAWNAWRERAYRAYTNTERGVENGTSA